MGKYIAVAATKNKAIEDWGGISEYTDNALTELAESAIDKAILIDFDETRQIGKIVSAKNDDGKLVLMVDIENKFIIKPSHRIVPGHYVKSNNWKRSIKGFHRIIESVESTSYGLTHTPCEKGLPEIKRADDS